MFEVSLAWCNFSDYSLKKVQNLQHRSQIWLRKVPGSTIGIQHVTMHLNYWKKISAPILVPPDWTEPFRCHVDAMQTSVGCTLTQFDDKRQDRVIAYYSKCLNSAEENYTSNDRELLGLVYFLKRFRCYVEESSFEVLTDNRVLRHFLSKKTLSRRDARWLDLFAEYNLYKISFVQGSAHVLGDELSRIPQPSEIQLSHMSIFQASIADSFESHYKTDQFFLKIVNALQGRYAEDKTDRYRLKALVPHFKLENGKLYFENKVCDPHQNIKEILRLAHDSPLGGHFSFHKTLSRLDKFYWAKKFTDIKAYFEVCMICQQSKNSRTKLFSTPQPLELPTRRWRSIATDFIVSLPVKSSGNDAFTTYLDRFSKRVHFLPNTSRSCAKTVARDFYDNIFKLHGLPDNIVSDNDPRFTSKFWKELMRLCDVQLKMASSHHPQTYGSSKITNRIIDNYLRWFCDHNQQNWDELLTAAEFAYKSANIEHVNIPPFELYLGWKPRSPLELLSNPDSFIESVHFLRNRLSAAKQYSLFVQRLAQSRQVAYNSK